MNRLAVVRERFAAVLPAFLRVQQQAPFFRDNAGARICISGTANRIPGEDELLVPTWLPFRCGKQRRVFLRLQRLRLLHQISERMLALALDCAFRVPRISGRIFRDDGIEFK